MPEITVGGAVRTTTVIIGAGQAGLAMSWWLTEHSIDHVVLEDRGNHLDERWLRTSAGRPARLAARRRLQVLDPERRLLGKERPKVGDESSEPGEDLDGYLG